MMEFWRRGFFLRGFGAEVGESKKLVSHDHYTALGLDYLLSLALILFFWALG